MRSQHSHALIRWLESNPGTTEREAGQALGFTRMATYQAMRRLREHKLVHISGYELRHRTGSGYTRQYTAGPGEDAPQPVVPEREQKRRKVEQGIKRKRQKRAEQALKTGGPIAYMAAIATKPRKSRGSKYGKLSY